MSNVAKILVAALLVVSGSILSGCGGNGNPDSTTSNLCDGSNVLVASSSPADVQSLCMAWTPLTYYKTEAYCISQMPYGVSWSSAAIQTECTTPMTSAECADVSDFFVDSAGIPHGLVLTEESDVCTASGCRHNYKVTGFTLFEGPITDANLSSQVAVCTEGGVFLGLRAFAP